LIWLACLSDLSFLPLAQGYTPSVPQMSLGKDIESKLVKLQRQLDSQE
jgi:hypothetical protein